MLCCCRAPECGMFTACSLRGLDKTITGRLTTAPDPWQCSHTLLLPQEGRPRLTLPRPFRRAAQHDTLSILSSQTLVAGLTRDPCLKQWHWIRAGMLWTSLSQETSPHFTNLMASQMNAKNTRTTTTVTAYSWDCFGCCWYCFAGVVITMFYEDRMGWQWSNYHYKPVSVSVWRLASLYVGVASLHSTASSLPERSFKSKQNVRHRREDKYLFMVTQELPGGHWRRKCKWLCLVGKACLSGADGIWQLQLCPIEARLPNNIILRILQILKVFFIFYNMTISD